MEVKDGKVPDDFRGKLTLITRADELEPSFKEVEFRAIAKPDLCVFTPRETQILSKLALIFRDARAKDISEVSHLPKQPWDITIRTCGENHLIDYLLSVDEKSEVSLEDAKESLKEHREVVHNFHLEPTR